MPEWLTSPYLDSLKIHVPTQQCTGPDNISNNILQNNKPKLWRWAGPFGWFLTSGQSCKYCVALLHSGQSCKYCVAPLHQPSQRLYSRCLSRNRRIYRWTPTAYQSLIKHMNSFSLLAFSVSVSMSQKYHTNISSIYRIWGILYIPLVEHTYV